jgi:hypothetical protein
VAPALVTILILSWIGLAVATGWGYASSWGYADAARHVTLAIPAFILGTLAHAMGMLYFIGTGRVIKDAAAEHKLGEEWAKEQKEWKQKVFPWATWTILLIMATSILGGAVDTGFLPAWVHGLLAVATLLAGGRAVLLQVSGISRSLEVLDSLEQAIGERMAARPSA